MGVLDHPWWLFQIIPGHYTDLKVPLLGKAEPWERGRGFYSRWLFFCCEIILSLNILASWTFLRWHLSEFSTPAFPFPPFLRVASILWSPGCDHSMDSLRICIQHLFLTFGWIPEGWQSRFLYPVLIPWQIRSAVSVVLSYKSFRNGNFQNADLLCNKNYSIFPRCGTLWTSRCFLRPFSN